MTSDVRTSESRVVDLGEKILAGLKARDWTQARLAVEADTSEEAISKIITGTTADPQLSTIRRIAYALGDTVGSFLDEKGFDLDAADRQRLRDFVDWAKAKLDASAPPRSPSAPNAVELAVIADSKPKSADAAAMPGLLRRKGARHIFRATGDSMNDAGILDNDLLFVRKAGVSRMAAGKIVVCTIAGRTYVKKLEMAQRRIRLTSANDRYAPIEVSRADITFVGIVLGRMGTPRA
jgi:transcriptional regulator with XRE-family HTH domain